ncbi:MAG: glycosyltransferase family 4 protein [Nitrospirae bacterium]|nr:glycosyltransferase family 4 protein [Nitrospirota bacterium]
MTIFYPVPEPMLSPKARFIQIINTAHALACAGAAVKLITGGVNCPNGSTLQETLLSHFSLMPHPNLEIISLPMLRKNEGGKSALPFSVSMVFNAALIGYLIAQEKADSVIFVRHLKTAALLIKLKRLHGMPVVFESHEIFHLTTEKISARKRLRRMESRVYRGADAIAAITERLRGDLVQLFSLEAATSITIPDAVRGDMIEAGLPYEQRRFIFYAGGFYPWKGVDLLIEAMRYMHGQMLIIAGGGQRLKELAALAAGMGLSGRVNFVGQLSHADVIELLRQTKVAVIPNMPESVSIYSSPLKMFEYMALQCPIAAANIPGVSEILTDGKDAVFFTPGDAASLCAALKTLIDNPDLAKRTAAAAQDLVKNFTYEKRGQSIIDFISGTFYN